MATPTLEEIEAAIAEAAAKGIAEGESDGQKFKAMPLADQIAAADRLAAKEVVSGGNAWGAVGRARFMPNWTE